MKTYSALIFICVYFLFQSCIEINQTITVNNDGSGSIKIQVDMGKTEQFLPKNSGFDFLNSVKNAPTYAEQACLKGINNLKTYTNSENSSYIISFDFENSQALNKALIKIYNPDSKQTNFSPRFYKITRHHFVFKNLTPFIRKYLPSDATNPLNEVFFRFVTINNSYIFHPGFKKNSNIRAIIDENKKKITLKYTLYDILKSEIDIGIKVKF